VQRWLALWTNLDDDDCENNNDDDNPTDPEQPDLLEIADIKASPGKRWQAKSRHRRDWARWRSTNPKQSDPLDTLTDLEQPGLQETDDHKASPGQRWHAQSRYRGTAPAGDRDQLRIHDAGRDEPDARDGRPQSDVAREENNLTPWNAKRIL
jgi:hypothetical protein